MQGVNDGDDGPGNGASEPAGNGASDRAGEGVDHLQAAALELIDAARAFLDVVEELVGDRDRLAEVAETVGTMAGLAARAVARTRPGPETAPDRSPPGSEGDPSRVQRITVT